MKTTIVNIFIKNYKFFYHVLGNSLLFVILWFTFLRFVPDSEFLVWLALAIPFCAWANVSALRESGLDEFFESERAKSGT